MPQIHGDEVHGEVISADASGGVAVTFYDAGTLTARTLSSTEFVTVTDVMLSSTVGGVFDLFFGTTTGAGRHIVKGILDAKSGLMKILKTPRCGPVGQGITLSAAAGQIDLVITGYISQK